MSEIIVNFVYNNIESKLNAKKEELMKNLFQNYALKINKDSKDLYFLYNGTKLDDNSKLEEINNSQEEITILVGEYEEKDNNETVDETKSLKEEIKILKKQNELLLENQKNLMNLILQLNEKIDNNKICPRCRGSGMVPKTLDWDSKFSLYYYPCGHYFSSLQYYSGYGEYNGRSNAFNFILDPCPLCKGSGFVKLGKYIRCDKCTEWCGYKNSDSSHSKRKFCDNCKGFGYIENEKIKKD